MVGSDALTGASYGMSIHVSFACLIGLFKLDTL